MWGRPVDVLVMKDGALLVSDDYNGIIYRVSYGEVTVACTLRGSGDAAAARVAALVVWWRVARRRAADDRRAAQKAAPCAACHGDEGNSANPAVPSLAGQPEQFIATQLVMFREGNRKNPHDVADGGAALATPT